MTYVVSAPTESYHSLPYAERAHYRAKMCTAICEFIENYRYEEGLSPTVREIQHGLGISSTSVVHYWLKELRDMDCVTWKPGMRRATVRVIRWPNRE